MGVMSVRELNANLSKALARAEAGEVIEITKNGKPFVELRAKPKDRMGDPAFRAKREELLASLKNHPIGLSGPATYEERTSR